MKVEKPKINHIEECTFDECIDDLDFYGKLIQVNPTKDAKENCKVDGCHFMRIDFTQFRFECDEYLDTIFENCDFSTCEFEGVSFIRCQFKNCKFAGTNFYKCSLKNVEIQDSLFRLANFSNGKIEKISCVDTSFEEARFFEMILRDVEFTNLNFTKTEILETSLKDIDLSKSVIEGIVIDLQSLKGVVVNSNQAVQLCGLLDINIVE